MVKAVVKALLSGLLTFIILLVTMGVYIKISGLNFDLEWRPLWSFILALAVALIVLVQQLIGGHFTRWCGVLRDGLVSVLTGIRAVPVINTCEQKLSHKAAKPAILILFLIWMSVWPFLSSMQTVDMLFVIMLYVVLGLGLNIVVGYAGLLNLGYVAFYAIGAYTYALLNTMYDVSFWICLPLSGITAAIAGFIIGFPVLRLRGDYLAIVTLGFGEIVRLVLNNWNSLTGGPDGIGRIAKPALFGLEFTRRAKQGGVPFHEYFGLDYSSSYRTIFLYFLALLLVIFTLFVINRLIRMPIGRSWEALREDEIACRSLGLNPTWIKLSSFTIGSSFAGFAGCLFAARQGFINPEAFTFVESVVVLAIVVLGGMGSQLGIILAAIFVVFLKDFTQDLAQYRMLIFGLIMIVMMIWRPRGLLPGKRRSIEVKQ